MKIIVYHVTSSIFISSIKEHGLSAIDIRKALPDLSVAMNEIIDTLDRKYSELGIDWGENAGFSGNCKRMANREYKNQSGMDYEYGSVYVTPSQSRILIYYSYEFGSELITYFYRLYRCLFVKLKDNSRDAFEAKYRKLADVINIENKVNLILKAEVDTDDMLSDVGKPLDKNDIEYIEFMREMCKGDIQRSYRMTRTLKPDEMEVLILEENKFKSLGNLSELEIPEEWVQIEII